VIVEKSFQSALKVNCRRGAKSNGVLAAPVMALIMVMTQSHHVMGRFTIPVYLRTIGWLGTGAMFAASVAFLFQSIR
jgi:Mn2+/Fe2+ NRAMP family transporter